MILSIAKQISRIKILCGNSNALLHMRYHLVLLIITTNYIVIILWLNGKHWILPHILSLSFQKMILSHVIFMFMRNICYNIRDGRKSY